MVATVVAVRRPTSARPGASGIIHPDGTIEGWVGGSCAQPVVVREALRALGDGQPRLLRLSKDVPAEGRRGDGIVELVMTCHSGGTLEIYVEPHLPAPVLWVAGTTPIAGALVALGSAAGWRVIDLRSDRGPGRLPGRRTGHRRNGYHRAGPGRGAGRRRRDPGDLGRGGRSPAALTREAAYVGLVASPTRAAVVREWLREEAGIPDERLAALRAPAGIDLGAETAEEVALSILAELVQVRRGTASFVASPGPATLAGRPGAGDPARRGRHRPAGPGLRHDRGPGARPPSCRTRRRRLRVLLDGLPDELHPRARGISPVLGGIARPSLIPPRRPWRSPHALRRFRSDQRVPREGLGLRHRSRAGRPVRPRRREDRGHRRDPFQGDGQGRDRVHQRPVRRRTWSSPSRSRRIGR